MVKLIFSIRKHAVNCVFVVLVARQQNATIAIATCLAGLFYFILPNYVIGLMPMGAAGYFLATASMMICQC